MRLYTSLHIRQPESVYIHIATLLPAASTAVIQPLSLQTSIKHLSSTSNACANSKSQYLVKVASYHTTNMSATIVSQTIRQFSAQAARPISKAQSAMTTTIIASAVALPFVPPALESARERKMGHPNAERKHSVPLCRHP